MELLPLRLVSGASSLHYAPSKKEQWWRTLMAVLIGIGIPGMAIRYGAWPGANRGVAPARGWRQQPKSEAARPQTRQPSSLSQYPALEKADIRPLPPQCGSSRCRSTQRERILIGHRASRRSGERPPPAFPPSLGRRESPLWLAQASKLAPAHALCGTILATILHLRSHRRATMSAGVSPRRRAASSLAKRDC